MKFTRLAKRNEMPVVELGNTGLRVPVLGLGGECVFKYGKTGEAEAVFRKAMDLGVRYIDTAHDYNKSQERLGRFLKNYTDHDVVIATKSSKRDRTGFMRELDACTRKLGRIPDIMHVHNVTKGEKRTILKKTGALEAAFEAREKGYCRYVGITSHDDPDTLYDIIEQADGIDVAMVAISAGDTRFLKDVVPLCRSKGIGLIAMKVMGRGVLVRPDGPGIRRAPDALRYALSTSANISIVGFSLPAEVIEMVEAARRFRPMSEESMRAMAESVESYADEVSFYAGSKPDWEHCIKMRNSMDDFIPHIMKFPRNEVESLVARLEKNKPIFTTRISDEQGKYREGHLVRVNFWDEPLKIISITTKKSIRSHPFLDELTEKQIEEISGHTYDIIELR